ncbi:MAG: AsmA family protein [Pseudomonadales bacterium]
MMSTWIKILLGASAAALALFVALVAYVALVVEPDDFRPLIVDAVTANTGRSFELDSGLGLGFVPCCSITLGGAALGNPEGFPDEDFARIDGAALSLRIWPLITRQAVEIGGVTLNGLAMNLVRLPDGRDNWTFDVATPAPAADPDAAGAPTDLRIDDVRVRDGAVRYDDRQSGQAYAATGLRIDAEQVRYADALQVQAPALQVTVTGSGLPEGGVRVTVAAREVAMTPGEAMAAAISAGRAEIEAAGATLTFTADGRAAAGSDGALAGTFTLDPLSPRDLLGTLNGNGYQPADPAALNRLSARGSWQLSGTALTVDGLEVRLDDTLLTGSLGMDDLGAGRVRAQLAVDAIDIDRYLSAPAPAAAAGAAPAEPTVIPLAMLADLDVDARLQIGRLRVSGIEVGNATAALTAAGGSAAVKLDAGVGGGTLAVDGEGTVGGEAPRLAGTLRADGISPRAVLTALGAAPDTADPAALTRLSGQSRWRLEPGSLALEAMAWQLDQSRLTGNLRVVDFDGPGLRFEIDVDRFDLDAYLPPEADDPQGTATDTAVPVELIRPLDVAGRLRAGTLIASGLTLTDVAADVTARGGVLRLDPLRAALYGGEYRGTIVVDATGSKAALTLAQSVTSVQVAEVLRGWFDTDLLAGSLSFNLDGSGTGNTVTELLRGIGADVTMNLSDGVYRGADLLYEFRRARALFRNEPAPAESGRGETPIRALSLAGQLVDGVLKSDQIRAETPYLRLLGSGGLNLIDLALDYKLDAELLQSADTAGGGLQDLLGNAVPLTLTGPVTAPRVGIDLKGMVTTRLRDTVQQRARDALLERLAPRQEAPAAAPDASAPEAGAAQAEPAPAAEPAPETKAPSARDLLKRGLRDLIRPPAEEPPPAPESG